MKNKQLARKFRGVWIPKEIWLSSKLSPREKFFLIEIDSLDNDERGCYANNRHFSELFHISVNMVSRVIKSLIEKKLMVSKIDRRAGNKRSLKVIPGILGPYHTKVGEGVPHKSVRGSPTEVGDPITQKCATPRTQKCEHNNTNTNNQMNSAINTIGSFPLNIEELGLEERLKHKAAEYDLKIHSVLPARTRGERTTYNRLREFLCELILTNQRDERVFGLVVRWAKEARNINGNPRAIWIAKCKEQLGFAGRGKRLLTKVKK